MKIIHLYLKALVFGGAIGILSATLIYPAIVVCIRLIQGYNDL